MSLFSELRQHIEAAFERAEKGDSKITDRILNMEGMSGRKTRHFYNNLLNKSDARYLEIGTWKGSSACSAMCGNNATVVCIDNWSEFGGPKDEFLSNFDAYKGVNNARFIEQDCYKVDITQLPKFNIYMFDGNHTKDSHYKALIHYYNCLDDMFVFIVDDWNWKDVRDGTYASFKQLQLTVLYEREIKTTDDDTHPPWGSEKQQQWHNGIYVAILQKTSHRLFNPSVSLPPITDALLGNPAPPTTNVILTIFAGRHRYLSILKRYLDRLLEKNILTEVHLWDYAKDSSDSVYLREIEAENPKYVYKKPIHNMPHWNEYYLYYTTASYAAEDIIIKCDDDIVYIDTDQMSTYINEIKQGGLYYPNIVNNDVCAYIQTKYGVHDLCNDSDMYFKYGKDDVPFTGWDGGWYARYDRAAAVHTEFLTNKKNFSIRAPTFPWKGRISINFFGARFATIKKYFELFMQHGKNNDEGFYSYDLYNYVNGSNYIVPFMNIVHFAFNPQNAFALDNAYLESYRILSKRPDLNVFPHLLDLSHKDCLPVNHYNYLKQLKASGFEPKVIYDIGSCVLHWTNKAKELWPDATYILFDAFREAEFLYTGYEYRMGVLCDQDNRELRFYKNVEQPGGNSYFREIGCENGKYFPEDRYTVELGMRLDTIVKERGFPLPDLIKIDVQGAERDIISGGVNTISNATHMICEMQHTNYNDGAPKVSETQPYIESLGWECVAPMLQNNGPDADYGFKNLMRK